jgi:hypothetical protein
MRHHLKNQMLADKLEFSVNGREPDSRSGRYFPDRDGQK